MNCTAPQPAKRQRPAVPGLADFDSLPDIARVGWPVVVGLYGVSKDTILRRIEKGLVPKPIRQGGTTQFVVGDLRAALANK